MGFLPYNGHNDETYERVVMEDLSKFRGVIPPVIIPLKGDRTLDAVSFERSIDRMIEAGVDGLFFLGSSGEVAFLTNDERDRVLTAALKIVDGRVPVLVGIIDMEIKPSACRSTKAWTPSWRRRRSTRWAAR